MNTSKKVLIIEDDVDLVEAMKIILEAEEYSVMTSYTPDEGFQMAESNLPDLIILDAMFERSHKARGFDYAVKMKQNAALAPIPILMVSAVNKEHPGFGFSPGEFLPVDDFIDKPAQPEDLVSKARQLMAQGTSRWVDWPNERV